MVRDDDARHARDARGEKGERPDVDDVDDPRAQPAQFPHEVREQQRRGARRVRPQLRVPRERCELRPLRMDDDGRLVEPLEDLAEIRLDRAPRGGLMEVRDHASTSSRTAANSSAVRVQVNRAACSKPRRRRSSARPGSSSTRCSAPRDRLDVDRVAEEARVADDLRDGGALARDDRRAARERLEHRVAEALVERRVDVRERSAVERDELLVGHTPEKADVRPRERAQFPLALAELAADEKLRIGVDARERC